MRTTIEIRDDQRARLLDLAARRGLKGFSTLVQEALDEFLAGEKDRDRRLSRALSTLGTLDDDESAALRESVKRSRSTWR